ncbi:MAG: Hsp20/alpha crystallin family protein [Candidatus Omnitrophica bacterium]|nr:Hsp20/alpha crystallin family protein [Candidatus Omnitrophota bacterium]
MALIKWSGQNVWEPFRELGQLQEEINRVFGRSLAPVEWLPKNGGEWVPKVDIVEEKDRILVRTDLPGMKQEDISVEVEGDLLTMTGERKHEYEKKEGQAFRIERSYGTFMRSFTLPSTVDATKVNAAYKNGVLEISLPKREGTKAKHITVDVK